MNTENTPVIQAVSADQIAGRLPIPLLSPEGFNASSVVSSGGITLLAGEAGVDKIALALQLAFGTASLPDGERGPLDCFTATGGPVLYVTTDKSPLVITARLKAISRRGLQDEAQRTAALARVHVLDLSRTPLFEPAAGAASGTLLGRLKGLFAPASAAEARRGPGWEPLLHAAADLRPAVVILNSAKLDQPAPAIRVVRELAFALDAIAQHAGGPADPSRPLPAFLLVADSNEGAFKTHDPMAYGWPEAPWDAVMTLARARAKSERVLRIPHALHGTSRLSIRLEAVTQELPAHGEGPPSPAVVGFARGASDTWQRGAYGTVRAASHRDDHATARAEAPRLPLDGGGAPAENVNGSANVNGDRSDDMPDVPPVEAADENRQQPGWEPA